MPKLVVKGDFPTVEFNKGEVEGVTEYSKLILAKKRDSKGILTDRVMAEIGEVAVDFILEKHNKNRKWFRGRFHKDFTNLDETVSLEVKTRRWYSDIFEDLDVRLDFREVENAQEATHLVPVVFEDLFDGGARITSPGVFLLSSYFTGCEKDKPKVPRDYRLKFPCFRTTWKLVFDNPELYGYKPWESFVDVF